MDSHIRKVYVPMTETGFYILLCLQKPNHGYGIVQMVEKMTDGDALILLHLADSRKTIKTAAEDRAKALSAKQEEPESEGEQ